MMKKLTPWFLILSLLVGMPAFALAEESGTVDTSAVGETEAPETEMGGKPKPPLGKPGMMGPRDAASGLPTGKSLNGLPPGTPIKNMMEKRMENGSTGPKLPIGLKDKMLEKRMENGSSGPKLPPEMIKDRMMQHASGTGKMMDRMQLLKNGKMDRKMDAAKEFIRQAAERMRNAIDRLNKLAGRLEDAHTKMKEKGVNVDAAAALLVVAKTKITEAQTAIEAAKAQAEAAKPTGTGTSTGEISDASRQAVKDAMTRAKTAIDAAHKALVEAIKATKAAGGVGSENSSNPGTASTTN